MYTVKEIKSWYKPNEPPRILFMLTEEDAQTMAKEQIGRKLTDDELYQVKKGLEWGLECWGHVMSVAIDEAVDE